ncbi:MAG: hypothetical protein H6810_11920 [Phycisphaeraceae bacterium]|nr:MAG: hypothetical protein H6810_11920 [Phycisphaeraceae bacterium]
MSKIAPAHSPRLLVLSAVLLAVLTGCQSGSIRSAQVLMRTGRVHEARDELDAMARDGFPQAHAILGWLELGTALRETGAYAPSSRAFLHAEEGFDAEDRRPQTSITEEMWAAATSPIAVDYRGAPTDRVLAPTYRGINSLLLGDPDAARTAFNEAAIRQDQTLELRRKRIEAAREVRSRPAYADRIDVGRSVDLVEHDPDLAARFASLEQFRPYRDYVNPFAELVHAVFRLGAGEDAADADRAVALLRSVAGMVPENGAVQQTLADAEAAAAGTPEAGVTHVFFATGFGPWRESFRVDLPLFLVNDEVDYVGVSFPVLTFDDRYVDLLRVESPDEIVGTSVVADMDRIVSVEFREELPVLITRAVIGAAAKTAAAWGLNKATEDDETLNAVVRLAAGLYMFSQNKADTRSWASLPKQFQYARINTPPSGQLYLSTPDGQSVPIRVPPDGVSLVFVRSTRPGVPLHVETVVLGGEVKPQ